MVRARERADMVNNNFISDAELRRLINTWTAKLWNHLVKVSPERYVRDQTLTADGATQDFDVPADYYGTYGIENIVDSGQSIYEPLHRLVGDEELLIANSTGSGIAIGYTFRYNNTTPTTQLIRIIPTPTTYDIRHRYIVHPPEYATNGDDDAVEVIGIAGFEEYVIIGCAIDMRIKEESSVVQLRQSQGEIEQHLYEMAENREIDNAGHVHDVRGAGRDSYYDGASYRWARRYW